MSTGNVIRGWWNNVPRTATADQPYEFQDGEDAPKTMNHLIADWEAIRRHRIDLEAELLKVSEHEKRCVTAINEELKRLGVPRHD